MKAVIQRVKQSSVSAENKLVSQIGPGLLVLLGVAQDDELTDADYLANKIIHLRIFEDKDGKMNRSLLEAGGEMMVVSQFTLFADCAKGRRPSFADAATPAKAEAMYQYFISRVSSMGVRVKSGIFRAMMDVALINDGPVTIIIDSP
ncbi:MAG: D-aminoacyl-tRNA deacylase [Desulfobacterales bacterium]|jgi:D-tyrosyl-tRNA(Tyr) deacylase|nr:D-aminoacyl-tRNA deacylase [Desulfobacterales bacterium]